MKPYDVFARIHNIPDYLKQHGRFCTWRYETHNGRTTKIPYNPRTGLLARSNAVESFCSFDEAVSAVSDYSGIGLGVFDGISAIDIDHCVDEVGRLSNMARDIIDCMDSYTELSPSGKGIRIIFRTSDFLYDKERFYVHNQKSGLEVYVAKATSKFVTLTGNRLEGTGELAQRDEALTEVLEKYMRRGTDKHECHKPALKLLSSKIECSDDKLIEKAQAAKNGTQFSALWAGDITGYPSQSEADLALCSHLAFWTCRDAERMDSLFRRSGLMRDKWDSRRGSSTYGADVITKAIAGCHEVYSPKKESNSLAPMPKHENTDAAITEDKIIEKLITDYLIGGNPLYGFSHIGSGELLADFVKEKARFIPARNIWLIYDGSVWKKDHQGVGIMSECKQLARLLEVHKHILPEESIKASLATIKKWQSRSYRETVIKDATTVRPMNMREFDDAPYLVNTPNGTLDLQTMEFREHSAFDYLTQKTEAVYNPNATSPRWTRFLEEIFQGDKELENFFQRACGYALSGDTRFECFFILFGMTTRNGKGTAMEVLLKTFGDYAKAASPSSFAQKHRYNGSAPNEDIARLAGARLVSASEPDKKMTLHASLLKTITGNDTLVARYLHENSFEYKSAFKLFFSVNDLPEVTDQTLFASDRVYVIPFSRHFDMAARDMGLKQELMQPENLSAVLNWAVEGYRLLMEQGLDTPRAVREATQSYARTSNRFQAFFDEYLERADGCAASTGEAHVKYKEWCAAHGEDGMNQKAFFAELSRRGEVRFMRPPRTQNSPRNMLVNYRFKDAPTDANDGDVGDFE